MISDDVMVIAIRAATAQLTELSDLLADIVDAARPEGDTATVPTELIRRAREKLAGTEAGREAMERRLRACGDSNE